MQRILEKHSNRKSILILFAIVVIIEILFAVLLPKGDNAVMIDMAGSTSANGIYEIIDNYDANIRQSYIVGALTLDLVFPIAYFLLFALLLFTYWRKVWMVFLPMLQAIFDLAENTGIVIMLRSWPEQLMGVANFVVIMSWLKWGFCAVTIVLIIVGVAKTIVKNKR